MNQLGTILPTNRTYAINARWADNLRQQKAKVYDTIDGDRKFIGGELRVYRNAREYTIVGRDLKIKWFRHDEDGDRRIDG